jgi:predicted O-methyltransferase YrrM
VFNDIDKHQYGEVYDAARRVLRKGRLLISDNMLWYGKVLEENPSDAATAGVQALTRKLHASSELVTTLVPLRDGVTVSVRSGRPGEEAGSAWTARTCPSTWR